MTARRLLLVSFAFLASCGSGSRVDAGAGGGTVGGGGGSSTGGGTATGGGAATGGGGGTATGGGGGGFIGDGGCAGGEAINLDTGAVTVLGTLVGAPPQINTSCGTGNQHRVYSFTLSTQQDVFVQISSATFQPVIALFSGAACARELRCGAANLQGATSITGAALPPGAYSLVVDSIGASAPSSYDLYVSRPAATPGALASGTPVAGLSGSKGTWQYFQFTVGSSTAITATLSGGTGDADLYLSGGEPTTTAYLQASRDAGTAESVVQSAPTAGTWFVGVYAKDTFSGVTLSATW